jgi:SAM-dependent methyltransferase
MELQEIVACPKCRNKLSATGPGWTCTNPACTCGRVGFPYAGGQPVLVDFERSVLRREDYGEVPPGQPRELDRSGSSPGIVGRFRTLVFGRNHVSEKKSTDLLCALKQRAARARLLIIGGGEPGEGTARFYDDPSVETVAISVFPSRYASFLTDPQQLPFIDGVFDGVWVQATLEHAIEPRQVIEEMRRVLKPGGVIFAETLFMMPVHEGARDFVRYTLAGHRWQFRDFEPLDIGPLGGAGWALLWMIAYFWRALGLGDKPVLLLSAPFFWLRHCDRLMRSRPSGDAGIGFYFVGRKTDTAIRPRDVISYYESQ